MVSREIVFSFFFQAEDGIRDWSVTGVQTCALPISLLGGRRGERQRRDGVGFAGGQLGGSRVRVGAAGRRGKWKRPRRVIKSGEGRVGEEGRSRWWPDHLKKKKNSNVGRGVLREQKQ